VLVTGAAGFIGAHVLQRLKIDNHQCIGIDNFSNYYSPNLKEQRAKNLGVDDVIEILDLTSRFELIDFFKRNNPDVVIHLAAQPGVRYSKVDANSYIQSNIIATENIIEGCRQAKVNKLIYASSSSVYGSEITETFEENYRGNNVKNLYALTKRFNEDRIALEESFESIGLRFFSVYGPWGRPDMAYFRLIGSVLGLRSFTMFGNGEQLRDYTYISDVVDSIVAIMKRNQLPKVINIGGGQPFSLNKMNTLVEQYFGKRTEIDVAKKDETEALMTRASTNLLSKLELPVPKVNFEFGIAQVCDWAKSIPVEEFSEWLSSSK
jgi:UDP-glucuronate 4-epimerase